MRKQDLDYLLEAAVAKALGVSLPVHHRRPHRKTTKSRQVAHRLQRAA